MGAGTRRAGRVAHPTPSRILKGGVLLLLTGFRIFVIKFSSKACVRCLPHPHRAQGFVNSTTQLLNCDFVRSYTLKHFLKQHTITIHKNSHINFISNNRKAAGQLFSQFTYENPRLLVVHVCAHAFLVVWRPAASAESNYTINREQNLYT